MEIMMLATTIRSVALAHYVPFAGFQVDAICTKVQAYLPVTKHQIQLSLEWIAQTGHKG